MLRKLAPTEKIETRNFGGFCPYWTVVDRTVLVADTAEEIIRALPNDARIVDHVSVLELLQFNYMLGDRTLVQGIRRIPWHSTLMGSGELIRGKPIPHGNRLVEPQEAARTLRGLLEEELHDALQGHMRVFLLLSGGLDSRVVAGILKKLEPQLQAEISCVTWGQRQSRDVTYASRIASWYDWEFHHVEYGVELAWSNILRGARWGGSEVAGIHLHGADWFKSAKPDDIVIAASFGDGVGRAEFSSIHLKELSLESIGNPQRLLRTTIANESIPTAETDRRAAWENAQMIGDWACYELDMQENYMRRMLCHAMDYVRQFCSLHQAFTSDSVVSYMWSLSPDCRNDEIYHELLKILDLKLYTLPWARTGVAPDGTNELDPKLTKDFHQWGRWLRHDLRPRLESLVLSGGLNKLGLFDLSALHRVWNSFLAEPGQGFGSGELIVKLASIELSRRYFGLDSCRIPIGFARLISDTVRRGLRSTQNSMRHPRIRTRNLDH